MKFHLNIPFVLTTLSLSAVFSISHAQLLDKIRKKAEKAAEKVVEDVISKEDGSGEQTSARKSGETTPARAAVKPVFDFVPGDSLLLNDDLSGETPGSMPRRWKTSGSGQVVSFPGIAGKWFLLNEFTTYKLDSSRAMPADFSLEFDIITRSDQASDLNDFSFGFSRDNSVRSYTGDAYNENAITQTTIHYWNEEVINSSSDTRSYNTRDFELAGYANAVMHVSIQVNGTHMKVYLDKTKVLDADMFDPGVKKYFYLSTSTRIDNEAQIAVSNFRLKQ